MGLLRVSVILPAVCFALLLLPGTAQPTPAAFAACATVSVGGTAKVPDCMLRGTMRGSLTYGAEGHPYWTAQWSGRVVFRPDWKAFTKTPRYVLTSGSAVSWTISGSDEDCSYSGSGSLDSTKLSGDLVVGEQLREGLWHYAIEVRAGDSPDGTPVMPINQTCAGSSGVVDAAGAHGRFPFVVTGIFGQVAVRNEQTDSVSLNGNADEQDGHWSWRVAGPIFADEISQHGIDFIKDWELLWQPCTRAGKRWTSYFKPPTAAFRYVCAYDDSARRPNCTIGYGKLLHYGPCTAADKRVRWTVEQAEEQLYDEVKQQKYQGVVRAFSRKYGLSQCQFDALMAFVYNTGPGGFKWLTAPPRASDIGFEPASRLPLRGWEAIIASRLPRYTTAGGKTLPGLVRRRMAEFILFTASPCRCQGVAGPRTNDKRIPKIEIDPCKPPRGYPKAKYCPR